LAGPILNHKTFGENIMPTDTTHLIGISEIKNSDNHAVHIIVK